MGIADIDGAEARAKALIQIYAAIQPVLDPPTSVQTFTDAFQRLESLKSKDAWVTESNLGCLKTKTEKHWFLCPYKPPSFRHQGSRTLKEAYLHPTITKPTQNMNTVLSYPWASGSGKTVDLACSAFRHGAHLTIYISGPEDIKDSEATEDRQAKGKLKIQKIVKDTFEKFKIALKPFMDAAKAQSSSLKLVIAIDEASACRRFIRAIVADPTGFGGDAASHLASFYRKDDPPSVDVSFSVGGTGSNLATIGSYPKNITTKKTSASEYSEEVHDALIDMSKKRRLHFPTYKQLEQTLPIISKVSNSNARMMSIVLHEMAELNPYDSDDPQEDILLPSVLQSFLDSNGLSRLETLEKEAEAGAQILAVHLFQENLKVPKDMNQRDRLACSMDYGAPFNDRIDTMDNLVSKYGAVIAKPFPEVPASCDHCDLSEPFEVDPTMRFVALFLLHPPEKASIFEPSLFGFEVLCTHITKAAIAATLVIPEGNRPSIQVTLKKIGFEFDCLSVGTFTDKKLWEKLEHTVAVHSLYEIQKFMRTFVHRQPMTSVLFRPDETPHKDGVIQAYINLSDDNLRNVTFDKSKKFFLCDGPLCDELRNMVPRLANDDIFRPPLATGFFSGNSEYADGTVTFHAKLRGGSDEEIFKMTVSEQQKDLFSSDLNIRKLMANVKRCRSSHLEPIFGSRLVAVCGRRDKMALKITNNATHHRDFMMFCSDKMQIMDLGVMNALDIMRNGKTIKSFTKVCDYDENVT